MSDEEIIARIERLSKQGDTNAKLENRILTSVVGVLVLVIGFFLTTTLADTKTSIEVGNKSVVGDIKDVKVTVDAIKVSLASTQQQVVDHIKNDEEKFVQQTKEVNRFLKEK